jgi:hypothetical protein
MDVNIYGDVHRIRLYQTEDQLWAVVNTVTNVRVP